MIYLRTFSFGSLPGWFFIGKFLRLVHIRTVSLADLFKISFLRWSIYGQYSVLVFLSQFAWLVYLSTVSGLVYLMSVSLAGIIETVSLAGLSETVSWAGSSKTTFLGWPIWG